MELIARSKATIECPALEAFALVSNMERFGQWFPGVTSIVATNDLPHGQIGKTYLETVSVPLRGEQQIALTVREAAPGQRFVTEGEFPPLMPRMEITLTELGPRQTLVDWAMFSRNPSMPARLVMMPLARRSVQPRAEEGLARLKALLEQQTRKAP
jgi:hypothetical protein